MNISINDIDDGMADALKRVANDGERVVLKKRNKRVAALVSIEDFDLLEALENMADYQAALKARKEKGTISHAELKRRLGMK